MTHKEEKNLLQSVERSKWAFSTVNAYCEQKQNSIHFDQIILVAEAYSSLGLTLVMMGGL